MKIGSRNYPGYRWFRIFPPVIFICFCIYLINLEAVETPKKISKNKGDTLSFAGYKWVTKDSFDKITGPGNNYFSGSGENVYVDAEGKLHMKITQRNDRWYCPEVKLLDYLGYGRYYFYLDPLKQPLDKDVVIGMFIYDREDTSKFHKEIDIEISKWGKDSAQNSQYVIQPKEEAAYRFDTDLTLPTKHLIELRRKKVNFRSYYDDAHTDDAPMLITKYGEKHHYDYKSENERVSINVWLYRTSEPSNLKEFEVVISHFEFKQFWYDRIFKRDKQD